MGWYVFSLTSNLLLLTCTRTSVDQGSPSYSMGKRTWLCSVQEAELRLGRLGLEKSWLVNEAWTLPSKRLRAQVTLRCCGIVLVS